MPDTDPHPPIDVVEPPDDEIRDDLRIDSDALLRAVDELRRLESAKRDVPMSTPQFHDKAAQIEDLARAVFGLAARERTDGDRLAETQSESINDEAADDGSEQNEEPR